jgi:hypothetical protein
MPPKRARSGSTLSAMPCSVTHWRTRTRRRDLALAPVLADHPDADPAIAPLARTLKAPASRSPLLQPRDIPAHVRLPPLEVEQAVADALARPC